MKDEIKEILEALKPQDEEFTKAGIKKYPLSLSLREQKLLLDYITNLQEENGKLKTLYRRTSEHLFKIGNDELARYFQAQINDCPSFVPQNLRGDE